MTKARELAKMGEVLTNSQIGGRRNIVINGAMQVAQRGTSGTSANSTSYYTVDRFNFRGEPTGVYTIEQSTDAPSNFKNSTKITVTTPDTSIGSGERYWMASYLEGNSISHLNFGSSNAETVTLSFYVKSSLTGTFSGGLVNSAFNRAYAFTYIISSANTWERKTITIEGDTSGTWLTTNEIGIAVVWDLGAATNRQQSAGAWTASGSVAATGASQVIATDNATWQITGVQLEVGQATPFEHRSLGEELTLCQRYFYSHADGTRGDYEHVGSGTYYNSTNIYFTVFPPTAMRATPTLESTTGTNYYAAYRNAGADSFDLIEITNKSNLSSFELQGTGNVSGTAGHGTFVRLGGVSTTAKVFFDAEL